MTYTGLDDATIDCVVEVKGSHKLNKYMPGTRIPVLDEEKLYKEQPEYALLLSWHIADELAANLRKRGYNGRFIAPVAGTYEFSTDILGAVRGLHDELGAVGHRADAAGDSDSNIRALARDLFTDHVLAFELTSVLLVIAVVASVLLARRAPKATSDTAS